MIASNNQSKNPEHTKQSLWNARVLHVIRDYSAGVPEHLQYTESNGREENTTKQLPITEFAVCIFISGSMSPSPSPTSDSLQHSQIYKSRSYKYNLSFTGLAKRTVLSIHLL